MKSHLAAEAAGIGASVFGGTFDAAQVRVEDDPELASLKARSKQHFFRLMRLAEEKGPPKAHPPARRHASRTSRSLASGGAIHHCYISRDEFIL